MFATASVMARASSCFCACVRPGNISTRTIGIDRPPSPVGATAPCSTKCRATAAAYASSRARTVASDITSGRTQRVFTRAASGASIEPMGLYQRGAHARARSSLHGGRATDNVAGVDEAGCGPLAGPVVAGAVILDPGLARAWWSDLRDSKMLPADDRERLAARDPRVMRVGRRHRFPRVHRRARAHRAHASTRCAAPSRRCRAAGHAAHRRDVAARATATARSSTATRSSPRSRRHPSSRRWRATR